MSFKHYALRKDLKTPLGWMEIELTKREILENAAEHYVEKLNKYCKSKGFKRRFQLIDRSDPENWMIYQPKGRNEDEFVVIGILNSNPHLKGEQRYYKVKQIVTFYKQFIKK